jgi:hypothetical protein
MSTFERVIAELEEISAKLEEQRRERQRLEDEEFEARQLLAFLPEMETRILCDLERDRQIEQHRQTVLAIARRLADAYTNPVLLTLQFARLQLEWNRLERLITALWREAANLTDSD